MTARQLDTWKKTPLAVNTQPDISTVGNRTVMDMAVRAGAWMRWLAAAGRMVRTLQRFQTTILKSRLRLRERSTAATCPLLSAAIVPSKAVSQVPAISYAIAILLIQRATEVGRVMHYGEVAGALGVGLCKLLTKLIMAWRSSGLALSKLYFAPPGIITSGAGLLSQFSTEAISNALLVSIARLAASVPARNFGGVALSAWAAVTSKKCQGL